MIRILLYEKYDREFSPFLFHSWINQAVSILENIINILKTSKSLALLREKLQVQVHVSIKGS